MSRGLYAAVVAIAFLAAPGTTDSATVMKFDTDDLTSRAGDIVHGVIESKVSKPIPGSRQIFTEYTVRLIERWKGQDSGKTFTFRQLGGNLEGRGYFIAGASTYEVGEEIVTFLDKEHPITKTRFSIGLAQGKYHVEVDKTENTKLVSRRLEHLKLLDRLTGKIEEASEERKEQLSKLRGVVQKFLKAKRK